jgi:hypothetical protein
MRGLGKVIVKKFLLGNLCKLIFFPRNRTTKFKNLKMHNVWGTLALLSLMASANSYSLDIVGNQCSASSDCDPPFVLCSAATSLCTHKSILPITGTEIIGLLLFIIIAGVAVTAGVGGGSLFTPIGVMFFYFDTR